MFEVMIIENKPLPKIRGREEEQKVMSKKSNFILGNESGVALVVALLMIVILSLIGLASSSTSTFEIRLSGNKRGATDAFYATDTGLQAVKGKPENFTCSENPTPPVLPTELATEGIDSKNTQPLLILPSGYSFKDPPQVTIYHTTQTKVPRGIGTSAIRFNFNNYIVDSTGMDQMDLGSTKSKCEIREKIVRLLPTD